MSGNTSYCSHPRSRLGDEEIAAAVAVVLAGLARARSAVAVPSEPAVPPSAWADPARRLRAPLQCGPGAWRASAFPR
ncbi:MAG TPA: acyl-CoA carboxylase epsilon subunit [Pseudonocardiaceae bacterium]|nr:acyl-CoA carboxylase epsilon subunit [Pseudonocardiaceae bacterium]